MLNCSFIFRHAGAYSAEEVIRIMRDKLIRLQKLYIEQFQRLQYLLREERRQYCFSSRREREEAYMSIHAQPKETPEESAAYEEIRALNHYNKPHGAEALLYHRLMEKRQRAAAAAATGHLSTTAAAAAAASTAAASTSAGTENAAAGSSASSSSQQQRCTFSMTETTKCGEEAVPMSKYCMKHVLSDPNQVLFRACGVTTNAEDGPCTTPVADLFDSAACVFHTPLQASIYEEKVK